MFYDKSVTELCTLYVRIYISFTFCSQFYQVFLYNTNNLHKYEWFQVFLSNTNDLYTIILFQLTTSI